MTAEERTGVSRRDGFLERDIIGQVPGDEAGIVDQNEVRVVAFFSASSSFCPGTPISLIAMP